MTRGDPRPAGERRPTLDEVAARAGVSRATVSRVVNDFPHISPDVRRVVRAAIDELAYVPNRTARALASRRAESIALVVAESDGLVFGEPFFAGVVRGVNAALADTSYQLLMAMVSTDAERDRLVDYLYASDVDGVLFVAFRGSDPLPERLERAGLATVIAGRPHDAKVVSYVDADNVGGAREATSYLLGLGRREVAIVAGPPDTVAGWSRLDGYREALTQAGVPVDDELIVYGDFGVDSGAVAMRGLLRRRPTVDAVFAASDPMALGVLRALSEVGRWVPEDVAVVGYDGSMLAEHATPPLTTVHQPSERMGREMARLLLARLRGEPVDSHAVIVPTTLVRRASA